MMQGRVLVAALLAVVVLALAPSAHSSRFCHPYDNNKEDASQCLVEALLPRDPTPFELWPGNQFCVSCNFFWGCVFGAIEALILYLVVMYVLEQFDPPGEKLMWEPRQSCQLSSSSSLCSSTWNWLVRGLSLTWSAVSVTMSAFGWIYWITIVCFWWNFISYMMLGACWLFGPTLFGPYTYQHSNQTREQRRLKRETVNHRVKITGLMLALITLALFPNVSLMPSQVYRHIRMAEMMITPEDPHVQQLTETFHANVPEDWFKQQPFHEQMLIVDKFIYKNIIWKSDMEQYGMVGLLTTPAEVIERMAGDCQGQAVTTASLLWNLGFEAWVVETPFHWWTHARNNYTGQEYNLNTHGNGGNEGTVLPQPIDMVFTRWPDSCKTGTPNCTYVMQHNRENFLYVAPPHHAFAGAWTGAHIFVRDLLPDFLDGNETKLVTYGVATGLLVSVYASYVQDDLLHDVVTSDGRKRFAIRAALGCAVGVFTFIVMFVLIFVKYQFTEIHLSFALSFAFNFFASDYFNSRIGTPSALRRYAAFYGTA